MQCLAQPRAGDWRLRGRLRSEDGRPAAPAELLLSGVRPAATAQILPPRLHALRVQGLASPGSGLQLEAHEGSYRLTADAARLHHDPSHSFYQALPRIALSRRTRLAWAALLTLLRVPLVSRLLK